MPRKVFISFLGTNHYVPVNYTYKNQTVKNVRFIQEALLRIFTKDWTKDDQAYIFITEEAYQSNWIDGGHEDKKLQGLKARIERLYDEGYKLTVHPELNIPVGFLEKDIWEIFNRIYKKTLKDGDEVIIDITHGFRSIPMLAIVLMNYSKFLKGITLKGIFYGAFEILGSKNNVLQKPIESRNAPIVDLTEFSAIQDWATAAYDFSENGKADFIEKLALKQVNPILRSTQGNDESARKMKDLAKQLCELVAQLSTCRGNEIYEGQKAIYVQELISNIQRDYIEPLEPILDNVEKAVTKLNTKNSIKNGLNAVEWCINNGLIQQAYSLLLEFIITYMLIQVDKNLTKREYREVVSNAFRASGFKKKEKDWSDVLQRNKYMTKLLMQNSKFKQLNKVYNGLADYRNDIMHAGFSENRPAKDFDKYIRKSFYKVKEIIELNL